MLMAKTSCLGFRTSTTSFPRVLSQVPRHGHNMKSRPDINTCSTGMDGWQTLLSPSLLYHGTFLHMSRSGRGDRGYITFLNGIAQGRRQSQVRKDPWTTFFNGNSITSKRTVTPSQETEEDTHRSEFLLPQVVAKVPNNVF